MTIETAMAFIHSTSWQGSRPGLSRVTELLERLGNPQEKLRFVHVAGTNGKGSVCAMLASVLGTAGYRTGLFTSPYITRFHERMQCNGVEVTDEELIALVEEAAPLVEKMADKPTEFELITALAFVYFLKHQCELVVLEVGLGGRLDSTNVIPSPEVAVLTTMGLDHVEILGNTLEKIVAEKAGIIKGGHPVVLSAQTKSVEEQIAAVCQEKGAALHVTQPEELCLLTADLTGQTLHYRHHKELHLRLLGDYQLRNVALVIDTLEVLQELGYPVSESALREGLEQARWPGRFEILKQAPLTLVDGAHNYAGMAELCHCLRRYLPEKKLVFLVGVMKDKDYRSMLKMLAPFAQAFVAVALPLQRALPAAELQREIQAVFSGEVAMASSVEAGLRKAVSLQGGRGILCACGTLYMLGEVRRFF